MSNTERMGRALDQQLGNRELLSEDLNNPCRESELKSMYYELGRSQWADFICAIKAKANYENMKNHAGNKIKESLQEGQEDIQQIIQKLNKALEHTEHGTYIEVLERFSSELQNLQKAIYQHKIGPPNTESLQEGQEDIQQIIQKLNKALEHTEHGTYIEVLERFSSELQNLQKAIYQHKIGPPNTDIEAHLQQFANECYITGCLLALHDPPIYLDFSSSGQAPFPLIQPHQGQSLLKITSQFQTKELLIAIDFGTSYTGYAFQFKDKNQIWMPRWGSEYGYDTPKTPTCILFDEDGEFLEFGYDAVMTYTRHTQRTTAQKLYYFENFKMELYDRVLHRDLMIKARNGKRIRAMKVFSESLKYMKDHALNTIGRYTDRVKNFDVTWILTVPAIWSSAAKQFMREAATEAGLVTESDPERLIVALESEAASVWCKQLPSEGFMGGDLTEGMKIEEVPGTQYMVVDCGGGTIDITVHEVVKGGRLKELHSVSGNDKGGQTVDKHFLSFLREIFSGRVIDDFEENYPTDLQRLMYDFSTCKCSEKDASVVCPGGLQKIAEKTKTMESYFREIHGVYWEGGSIMLFQSYMENLHGESLRAIEHLIRRILRNPNLKISYIFLVGGFALSPHVRTLVREKFGSQCKVLCPVDAQMAVVKGAVRFGKMPNIVESRISLFSYGIRVNVRFDESIHKGKRTYVNKDGVKYCDFCFHCLVQKDESVGFDETRDYIFCPVEKDQTRMLFSFYCTEKTSAEFVDEDGMKKIGFFSVQMPNLKGGFNRSVRLEVCFGFTEMQATATDIESGETSSVKLDFMTQ